MRPELHNLDRDNWDDWTKEFCGLYENYGFGRGDEQSKSQQDNTNGETIYRGRYPDRTIIGFGHMISTEDKYKFDLMGRGPHEGNFMLYVSYPEMEIKGTFDEAHDPNCEWCNGDDKKAWDCKRKRKDRHIEYMFGAGANAQAGLETQFLDDSREMNKHDDECEQDENADPDDWNYCFCAERNQRKMMVKVPYSWEELIETNAKLMAMAR